MSYQRLRFCSLSIFYFTSSDVEFYSVYLIPNIMRSLLSQVSDAFMCDEEDNDDGNYDDDDEDDELYRASFIVCTTYT